MDYKDHKKIKTDYFWHKARKNFIDYLLSKYLKNKNQKGEIVEILEIGCGTGYQQDAILKHGNYTGIEKNNQAIKENKNGTIINSSLEDFKTEKKYGAICLFDVLEHIEKDFEALQKINNLLNKDAYLFLSVPSKKILFGEHDLAMEHYRRYEKKEIKKLLEKSNFRIKKIIYWNSFLFPLIALLRILKKIYQRNKNKELKHKSEIKKLPKIINQMLFLILNLENKFIKMGIKIPFGLSLYVVAQKKYEN